MKSRLATIKAGTDSVTPEESLKIHKNHEQCFKQWRKRKRMVYNSTVEILYKVWRLFLTLARNCWCMHSIHPITLSLPVLLEETI